MINIRTLTEQIEKALNEAEYKYINNLEVLVLDLNEGSTEFKSFMKDYPKVRLLLDGNKVYAWDALAMMHEGMADALGIKFDICNRFVIDGNTVVSEDLHVLRDEGLEELEDDEELSDFWIETVDNYAKNYKLIKEKLNISLPKDDEIFLDDVTKNKLMLTKYKEK